MNATSNGTPQSKEFAAEIAAAMQCLDRFLESMNALDIAAFEDCFNYPSVRLAKAELVVFERGRFSKNSFKSGSFEGWSRTDWAKRDILHASADKVHIDTQFVRYRADGSAMGAFDSIYIVTKQDGHWGIKMRSSFADMR
jgi:hypothetical protein